MEKYIKKINDKILEDGNIEKARKVKKKYQAIGGVLLAVGLGGFVALFIAFMILFFKFNTDEAFTCWLIAIPFLILLIPGSVLGRIGDALLPDDKQTKRKKRFYKYKSQKIQALQEKEDAEKEELEHDKIIKNID